MTDSNTDVNPAAANPGATSPRLPALLLQQKWVMRLRWLAGGAVTAGGLLEWFYLHWYDTGASITIVGVTILAYNAALWLLAWGRRDQKWTQFQLHALVWTQILPDLVCLTILTTQTGGYTSPLRVFFVFHMVFASLLLPRTMAYAVAGIAIGMMEVALAASSHSAPTRTNMAASLGCDLALWTTVYLASRITGIMRRKHRRVVRQNRHIRAISERLRQHQAALVRQEKMVAMGQMAAGVAHEVANPLASMDGLLQLMERRPERISPENLTRLREQIARVNQIVRQMTSFAHPDESGWEVANLNQVVTGVMQVLRFDRRLAGVAIETSLAPDMPAFRMQPKALQQVIINMVINAADALEGVATPRLCLRTIAKGAVAELEVEDNGQGIPPELCASIFEPFFTTKPPGKGTGLGLSISYTLIQKHGGEILVRSSPGKGATFTIRLPIQSAEKSAPAAGAPSRQRESASAEIATPEKSLP